MAEQSVSGLLGSDVREGYAELGDVRLHYVEAEEAPLILLPRGFPEFWYSWRLQIAPLAAARDSASSRPTCAATTCHRGRRASRHTTPTT
jgi:hypothetical protein